MYSWSQPFSSEQMLFSPQAQNDKDFNKYAFIGQLQPTVSIVHLVIYFQMVLICFGYLLLRAGILLSS